MGVLTTIKSKDNDTLKLIIQLQKSSKKRVNCGLFVLEGLRLCEDALANGFIHNKVVFSESFVKKYPEKVIEFSADGDAYKVSDELFKKLSDTVNPQGILTLCKIPETFEDEINPSGKYIALENLQDPSNLGAIARTAEAFKIDGIILQDGCDPYASKSLRASMGALLRIPVYQTNDMFSLFSKHRLKSFASVVRGDSRFINEVSFDNGCVVIIGNEANGISEDTLYKSDVKINIPMTGKAESLNASIAAAIIMWEMSR